jgi:protein-L-isoaspartate(D-aspartate) O-methyltransferase
MNRERERADFVRDLEARGISDEKVLDALARVPREEFVAPLDEARAFSDQALPIACGQTISQPYIVAAMTEALEISPAHKVLEIGTGSGYQAAVLSLLAREVVSIERHGALADSARARFWRLGYRNVTVIHADGTDGAESYAPFDRIIVTAAATEISPALTAQLAPGGVLVTPVGAPDRVQNLVRLRKDEAGKLTREDLMAVRFVPLLPGLPGAS